MAHTNIEHFRTITQKIILKCVFLKLICTRVKIDTFEKSYIYHRYSSSSSSSSVLYFYLHELKFSPNST